MCRFDSLCNYWKVRGDKLLHESCWRKNNFLWLLIRIKLIVQWNSKLLILFKPLCRLNSENLKSVITQNNEVSSAKYLGLDVKFLIGQQCKLLTSSGLSMDPWGNTVFTFCFIIINHWIFITKPALMQLDQVCSLAERHLSN